MSGYRMIFTDNKQSKRGIMSVVLATICVLSLLYGIIASYRLEGEVPLRFGGALVITLIMAIVGAGLGISARMDNTKFKVLPVIGIVINVVVIIVLSVLLWIGLR